MKPSPPGELWVRRTVCVLSSGTWIGGGLLLPRFQGEFVPLPGLALESVEGAAGVVEGRGFDGAGPADHPGPEDRGDDVAGFELQLATVAGHCAAEGEEMGGDEVGGTTQGFGAGDDVGADDRG